jgi:hypothetical protein
MPPIDEVDPLAYNDDHPPDEIEVLPTKPLKNRPGRKEARRVLCELQTMVDTSVDMRRETKELETLMSKTVAQVKTVETGMCELLLVRHYVEEEIAKKLKDNRSLWDGSRVEAIKRELQEVKKEMYVLSMTISSDKCHLHLTVLDRLRIDRYNELYAEKRRRKAAEAELESAQVEPKRRRREAPSH